MADSTHGTGDLAFDASKRARPQELNVFIALVTIVAAFELLGRLFVGDSFLLNTRDNVDGIFNQQRLEIIILQVSIIGIIAVGVTQVIITGGIDLSSGSVVGATAMIAMSFAQVSTYPRAVFPGLTDMPVIVPVAVGLGCGLIAGLINGVLVAYTKIPSFIATLGMMVTARGVARWWSKGQPISFPDRILCRDRQGPHARFDLPGAGDPVHGDPADTPGTGSTATQSVPTKRPHAFPASMSSITRSWSTPSPGLLSAVAALVLCSKNLTAQSGMGVMYELDAIAMAVIGGTSLSGGRGSIVGTVLGALIFGVIISGFTFLRIDAYYQEMIKGVIIVGAVVLDVYRQRLRGRA